MATRNPLIYNSGDLVEMTSGQMDSLIDNIVYQYSQISLGLINFIVVVFYHLNYF